jgi:hypothetical protein
MQVKVGSIHIEAARVPVPSVGAAARDVPARRDAQERALRAPPPERGRLVDLVV